MPPQGPAGHLVAIPAAPSNPVRSAGPSKKREDRFARRHRRASRNCPPRLGPHRQRAHDRHLLGGWPAHRRVRTRRQRAGGVWHEACGTAVGRSHETVQSWIWSAKCRVYAAVLSRFSQPFGRLPGSADNSADSVCGIAAATAANCADNVCRIIIGRQKTFDTVA